MFIIVVGDTFIFVYQFVFFATLSVVPHTNIAVTLRRATVVAVSYYKITVRKNAIFYQAEVFFSPVSSPSSTHTSRVLYMKIHLSIVEITNGLSLLLLEHTGSTAQYRSGSLPNLCVRKGYENTYYNMT